MKLLYLAIDKYVAYQKNIVKTKNKPKKYKHQCQSIT
jgi:hypothetical protein